MFHKIRMLFKSVHLKDCYCSNSVKFSCPISLCKTSTYTTRFCRLYSSLLSYWRNEPICLVQSFRRAIEVPAEPHTAISWILDPWANLTARVECLCSNSGRHLITDFIMLKWRIEINDHFEWCKIWPDEQYLYKELFQKFWQIEIWRSFILGVRRERVPLEISFGETKFVSGRFWTINVLDTQWWLVIILKHKSAFLEKDIKKTTSDAVQKYT